MPEATRVTVSYPADLSDWGRDAIDRSSFRAYLTKVHETASEGDVWEEFVGVGCCGDTLDVPLRVQRVESAGTRSDDTADGATITPETEFVYEERAACGIEGGWQVQSAEGP